MIDPTGKRCLHVGTLALLAALGLAPAARAADADADAFRARVVPLLERYCVDCHATDYAEAKVVLDRYADREAALADGSTWLKVRDVVEGGSMPPGDQPQPTPAERAAILGWIEGDYLPARCERRAGSAPVVIRRLNRQEYDNTIRDLLGLDLDLAADFPQDDIGFGFDNVGSALNISPVHVEKYLDAAEAAMDAAIVAPDVEGMPPIELIGLQTYPLPPDGAVEFEHTLKPGRYLVDFSLVRVGIAETVRPPRLRIGFGTDRREVEAARVQDETVVYRFWLGVAEEDKGVRVELAPGEAGRADVLKPAEVTANVSGDQRYGGKRGLHVDSMVVRGPVRLDEAALPAAHRRLIPADPGPGDAARLEAARAAVADFAGRAFRRPATDAEVEGILGMFLLAHDRGESYERALQVALATALASPRFLFLVEPEGSAEDRPLTEYELASRLSYFLWSSMPDAELTAHAAAGTLRANLRREVDRMLDDPKADAFASNFAGQWLQLRRLAGVAPDAELFPGFDDGLRDAMREETERFFAHILREDRSVLELLDADYTFVNEALARHYGIEGVEGESFRRVALSDRRRGGVLTQASVLTLTSNPNRTSPVKRGQWILQQLLGTPPPPPPPDVPELDDSQDAAGAATLRERLELHRADPRCASCHAQMDPLGFALENFDAVGRWREADGPSRVDPSGELPGGRRFADAVELRQVLGATESTKFARNLIKNMLTYALGRGLEADDFCTIEDIRARLVADDMRVRSIVLGIVESPAFQNRGVDR